jgi:hypothetical protein
MGPVVANAPGVSLAVEPELSSAGASVCRAVVSEGIDHRVKRLDLVL